ncbi:MAG: S8 family serine peptidase [Pirellulaceae bacterium]
MSTRLAQMLLVAGLAAMIPAASRGADQGNGAKSERRPGVVLYKCKANLPPDEQAALASVLVAYDMRLEKKLVNGTVLRVKSNAPDVGDEESLAEALQLSGAVEWAEPDYVEKAVTTPNDPYFGSQWQHTNIRSVGAWDITTGSSQIIVAVCDTGVDLDHPDLVTNLVLPGWNTYLNNTNCQDTHGHGTMVAGFAAAAGNNGIGVTGVAWNVRILPIRITFTDGDGSAYVSDIAEAIAYGTDHGAKVVNISFSGYYSDAIISAANYARNKGTLVVMAAANDNADLTGYPDPASIMLVGATTSADARASFSNYGTPIDVVAPGLSVWSTVNGGGYGYGSGTSFASPITAGLAALIYSINPNFTPAQVEGFIEFTGKDLGTAGEDNIYGFGLIQADAAVAAAGGNQPPKAVALASLTGGDIPLFVAFDGRGSTDPDGTIVSYSWSFGDGSQASGSDVTHTYTAAGSFTATLIVTDNLGATSSATLTIKATNPNTLNAPSNLTAKASGKTVTLNWVDNSGNEDGFYIERGLKRKGVTVFVRVATVGVGVQTCSETLAAETYYYRVQAFRNAVISGYSNTVSVRVR